MITKQTFKTWVENQLKDYFEEINYEDIREVRFTAHSILQPEAPEMEVIVIDRDEKGRPYVAGGEVACTVFRVPIQSLI